VYDHDPEDVDVLGWDEFIARQWESIFAGYRSGSGIRRTGRRWSDLIQAGLGCPQETADLLVRAQIFDRVDRDLEGTKDARDVVAGMYDVLADMRADLLELASDRQPAAAALLDQHARLLAAVHAYVFGHESRPGRPATFPAAGPAAGFPTAGRPAVGSGGEQPG
jgi:hypothetical protein